MFIEDNNNAQSYYIKKRNKTIWGNADARYKYLKNIYADNINDNEYDLIVDLTYGLDYQSINYWAKEYLGKNNISILKKLKNMLQLILSLVFITKMRSNWTN